MPPYPLTDSPVLPFIVIPVALVLLLLWGVSAASRRLDESAGTRQSAVLATLIGAVVWMALTWTVAATGVLRRWDVTPPPFAVLVLLSVLLGIRLSAGRYGARLAQGLPIWTLVAVQSFRLPLETAMHALSERGIMPAQMSYSGRNFDIVTGITALIVAIVARHRQARPLVAAWNVMGLALLLNVVGIAVVSTPRLQWFGSDRTSAFLTYPPFVWLPAIMVLAALAGHLLIFRALRANN